MTIHKYDMIIIGAGAAGLMTAYLASQKKKQKIMILDHSTKLAEKIRISGGGRCNFTNIYTEPNCYISQNPHFAKSALSRYTPYHFTELLDKHNIGYHEKTLGQLFCNNSANDIIELFQYLLNESGVELNQGIEIKNIQKSNTGYIVNTTKNEYLTDKLVIATGGLSIPQIGATPFGYNLARQFDINIITPEPALVPLTLSPDDLDKFNKLSGISFFSNTWIENTPNFKENTLFTHRGLSGPAILQISSYFKGGNTININMLPENNIEQLLIENRKSTKLLSNFLHQFFSQRLVDSLIQLIKFDKQLSNLSNKDIELINSIIHNLKLKPTGTLGYKKAEVTKGGVDTSHLSSKTMEANKHNGLYFVGEVVDVTGWLGGYNFQWAWASAHACASSL